MKLFLAVLGLLVGAMLIAYACWPQDPERPVDPPPTPTLTEPPAAVPDQYNNTNPVVQYHNTDVLPETGGITRL